MLDKIKDWIFNKVLGRAAAAGVAAGVAYLSKPEIVSMLAGWGVTINPTKLSGAVLIGVTFVLTLIYHVIEHNIQAVPTNAK